MNKFEVLQVVFTGFGVIVSIVMGVLVYDIGQKQNEINESSLKIQNFVEIFLMPQQVIVEKENGSKVASHWNLLIKNASAYPIYLNSFEINGVKTDIGSNAIPNDSGSWYAVPISNEIQVKGSFSINIYFEDYLGKKYMTEGFGSFNGLGWDIKSKKRIEIK